VNAYVLTYYDISWPFSALCNKRRCFILEHNIRPNVRHSFGEPAQTFGFSRMSKSDLRPISKLQGMTRHVDWVRRKRDHA